MALSKKTVREFDVQGDAAAVVDAWAQANKFDYRRTDGATRVFQRGNGILTGAMLATATQNGSKLCIECWVHANVFARVGALFLIPSDMGVESGGARGVLPRKIARDAMNKLLVQFGQPVIP